jgi:hypothetical protein
MSEMKKLLDAVIEMRAAQKLEWAALPANFNLWKRARQKQSVSVLEQTVDALAEELLRNCHSTDDNKGPAGRR